MPSQLNPYLSFAGNCRAAMEFYQSVLGGELVMNTFGEYGAEGPDADGIMHARLETDAGYTLMASDLPPGTSDLPPAGAITISLSGDDADRLRGYWEGLSEGGQVQMPLEQQMWGDEFGMLVDAYGTPWMVNIAGAA